MQPQITLVSTTPMQLDEAIIPSIQTPAPFTPATATAVTGGPSSSAAAVSRLAAAPPLPPERKAPAKETKESKAVRPAFGTQGIASFEPREADSPGYVMHSDQNIKVVLEKSLKRKLEYLSLSKPSPRGNYCVFGSDDPFGEDRKDHHIACLDWSRIGQAGFFCSSLALDEPVRDIHWAADDLLIAATGDGAIRLIQINSEHKMVQRARFTDLQHDAIREIALNKAHIGQFASGGFDKRLCLIDINTKERALQSVKLDNVIGSVKWPTCNQNVCISCTLDTGAYLVFDIRQTIRQPAFQATMGKNDLFTHERYTDHHVIMGFGDGEMQHIDMRVSNRILHRVQDPYVEGIGIIDYNAAVPGFVVSGFTDFDVWKQDSVTGQARVWSHSHQSTQVASNTSGYCTCAVFADAEHVLVSTSSGNMGVFTQNWTD